MPIPMCSGARCSPMLRPGISYYLVKTSVSVIGCRADTGKISECAEYPLEADCPATGNDSAVFGKLSSAKS